MALDKSFSSFLAMMDLSEPDPISSPNGAVAIPPAPPGTTPIPLLRFPNEILFLIADNFDAKDLDSFLQTNRRIASLLVPLIHRLASQSAWRIPTFNWAIANSFYGMVRALVEQGADIHAQDPVFGKTVLHGVVDERIVRLFLDKGVDADIQDCTGETALHLAAVKGHAPIVKILLERGADATLQNLRGETAVMLVLCTVDPGEWQKSGAVDYYRMNGGSSSSDDGLTLPIWDDGRHGEVVRLLLQTEGANPNLACTLGKTPLLWAVEKSYGDIVELLLEKDAHLDVLDGNGMAPLQLAVIPRTTTSVINPGIVKALLGNGADANIGSEVGRTPLLLLLRLADSYVWDEGFGEVFRLLVNAEGVDVNLVGAEGNTALLSAVRARRLLRPGGAQRDIIEILLGKGANPNARDSKDMTPLHLAALHAYDDIAQMLLDKGADILALQRYDYEHDRISTEPSRGSTALHLAIGGEVTKLLLERGAEKGIVHIRGLRGETALQVARWRTYQWESDAKIKLLLEYGAIDIEDGISGEVE